MTPTTSATRGRAALRLAGTCTAALMAVWGPAAHARDAATAQATPAPAAASAPDYSGVRYRPMVKTRCPDGEYRGPEPGKKQCVKDEYTWAVSRDFAKRFCMPESMVSDELKGAEAVTFRVVPSHEATCRLENGQEVCRRKAEMQLELYLRADLNLPKSHPEVRFFTSRLHDGSSGLLVQTNQLGKDSDRRLAGVWQEPLGYRPPYHAFSGPDESKRVKFMYLYFGDGNRAEPGEDFTETYYQSNWVDGIDLIRLGAGPAMSVGGVLVGRKTTPPQQRYGVGVIREVDLRRNSNRRPAMTRDEFVHVVDLPKAISDAIDDYERLQGDALSGSVRRALGLPGAPASPADIEPAVSPVTR